MYRDSNANVGHRVRTNVNYDDPDGIYRIDGGDRTYTYDELVIALEGDTDGLDFEQCVDSYFAVRERIVEGLTAGIITRVDLDGERANGGAGW